MKRFAEQAMETAGVYNTTGFNDDTLSFNPRTPRSTAPCRCRLIANPCRARHQLDMDDANEMITIWYTGWRRERCRGKEQDDGVTTSERQVGLIRVNLPIRFTRFDVFTWEEPE
ncbi:MAG: hypothetical protein U0Y68_22210 [Blastocatellia bacterium]